MTVPDKVKPVHQTDAELLDRIERLRNTSQDEHEYVDQDLAACIEAADNRDLDY